MAPQLRLPLLHHIQQAWSCCASSGAGSSDCSRGSTSPARVSSTATAHRASRGGHLIGHLLCSTITATWSSLGRHHAQPAAAAADDDAVGYFAVPATVIRTQQPARSPHTHPPTTHTHPPTHTHTHASAHTHTHTHTHLLPSVRACVCFVQVLLRDRKLLAGAHAAAAAAARHIITTTMPTTMTSHTHHHAVTYVHQRPTLLRVPVPLRCSSIPLAITEMQRLTTTVRSLINSDD